MFTNDNRTENFLSSMGVKWKYTNDLRFIDLIPGWETRNSGRPVAVREEAVTEYAELWQSGSAAPAPILYSTEKGHDILDGVQRLAAAQLCGVTCLSAYVVTSDSVKTICAVRTLANSRLQGRAEPMEWSRRHAVKVLVVENGFSVEEVSRLGGWKASDLRQIEKALKWTEAIVSIGGPDNFPDTVLNVLADSTTLEELRAFPKVQSQFLTVLKQSGLAAADAGPFIEEFYRPITKKSKSHEEYGERLAKFLESPEIVARIKGRKGCEMPPDINLRRTLKSAIGILEQMEMPGTTELVYLDEFFQLTKKITELLHDLSSRHQKPNKPRVPADMYQ